MLFDKKLIRVNAETKDKWDCLKKMAHLLALNDILTNEDEFFASVKEREEFISTGIGYGIAVPHGRSNVAKSLAIAVFHLKNTIDFNSLDDKPVKLLFMVAVPEKYASEYMKILSAVSKFLHIPDTINNLFSVNSVDQIYEILKGVEYENK
ncbi:MAG: PTS system IIA component fructose subfamily (modular protein) [Candidatus Cloacimonadota bacterium]|nr:MAG: PTS system IIA component fructose subfamily (modular protein) [Candidatus Cloacimonadota bacterium]